MSNPDDPIFPCDDENLQVDGNMMTSTLTPNHEHPHAICTVTSRDTGDNNKKYRISFDGVAEVQWLPDLIVSIDSNAEEITGTVECAKDLNDNLLDPNCDLEAAETFKGILEVANITVSTEGNISFKFIKVAPEIMEVTMTESGEAIFKYGDHEIGRIDKDHPGYLNIIEGVFSTKLDTLKALDNDYLDPSPESPDFTGDDLKSETGDPACSTSNILVNSPPPSPSMVLMTALALAFTKMLLSDKGREMLLEMKNASIVIHINNLAKKLLSLK